MAGDIADDQTGATIEWEGVVPVAPHGGVAGGEVDGRDLQVFRVRQGRGQERFLDETGLGLLDRGLSSRGVSEERRPFQRLRDDAGNEIEAAELVGAEYLWLRPSEFRCSQHHS